MPGVSVPGVGVLAPGSQPVSGAGLGLAVLVTGVLLVLGLGWAARRLLGLPVGTLRVIVAGFIGAGVAQGLGSGLRTTERGHAVTFFTVDIAVPVLVAMVFIVVTEVLVPTGSVPGVVELPSTRVMRLAMRCASIAVRLCARMSMSMPMTRPWPIASSRLA